MAPSRGPSHLHGPTLLEKVMPALPLIEDMVQGYWVMDARHQTLADMLSKDWKHA